LALKIKLLLLADAENNPEIVIFFNEDWNKKKIEDDILELFKNAKKQFFDIPTLNEIIDYVLNWAKIEGVRIEKSAIETISSSFENNLGAIMNEIEKLSLIEKNVTNDFLKSLNEYSVSAKLFDFSRVFLSKSKTKEKLLLYEVFDLQKIEWASAFNYFAKVAKDSANIKKLALQDENIKKGLVEYDNAVLSLLFG
jgi:DNA polymerase III delta subunit